MGWSEVQEIDYNVSIFQLFREELERVVGDSLRESGTESLAGLMSDVMNIKSGTPATHCVVPINDIRGIDSMKYAKGEKVLRCKLAAVYRLIDLFGWTQNIYNHVTVRVSQDTEHFLLNPFGMLYNEITASSLVKVNMQGQVVESGTTNFGVSVAGFMLHSAIHSARPDLKCIIHLHTPSIVAVSAMKCGLLYLSQESCLVGEVSYHSYEGILIEGDERDRIAKNLGVHNKVMMLRNHGAVCCGESIEEAFFYAYHLVLAADAQLKMGPLGVDNLITIPEETRQKVYQTAQRGAGGVNSKSEGGPDGSGDKAKKRAWGLGEMEFEALMRNLDNAGYRTGYVYKDGPLRALLSQYAKATKGAGRTKWVNSPNVYQKVEVLETGTPDPKKITKVEVIKFEDKK